MDVERLRALQGAAQTIAADVERDNQRWDGRAFTARTVSEQFGEIRAMVQALAKMCDHLAGVLIEQADLTEGERLRGHKAMHDEMRRRGVTH